MAEGDAAVIQSGRRDTGAADLPAGAGAAASSGEAAAEPRIAGWREGWIYLRRGLATARPWFGIQIRILAVYAAPALLAAYLAATVREPGSWERGAMLGLPWVTAILGTVVVMVAVGHHAHGRSVGVVRATREAVPWVPRYFWTNVHTTVIFWVPVGLLLEAREWQTEAMPVGGAGGLALAALWWLVLGAAALCLHTRTLLAPFLAVHSDLPGTLAALEAWRLSGRHFSVCLGTFVAATVPVGLPLALLGLGLALTLSGAALSAFLAAAPSLVWAGIQAVRPVLIPAVYALYNDLWNAELARRRRVGTPPVPGLARTLLALTRPLPHPGRWGSEQVRA
jgi:hypothetical protein